MRVFIFSMMSSVDADMATTPLRTALGRTKDAFMALEGAPKATCVIGKFVVSDVVFETMMGADVRRTGAAGLDRREYAAKRCEHRSKDNDGSSPSARTRRDRSHRASRGSSASPSLAAEREESQKAGAVAQHSAIGAARAVARRTLLEALTGAFAETRRVIMEVVMAAIFLCVCCVSDATNGASGARARFLSG